MESLALLDVLERIAVAVETLAASASAAPPVGKVADARAATRRESKEQEYAPEMSNEEFNRIVAKVTSGKVYKIEALKQKFGSPQAARRAAYWLQRRGFWVFDKQSWGYIKK